jgi:tetratricopeptide (TPR) repeat protein
MPSSPPVTSAFVRTIEEALDHFADPSWMGAHSPLAAPFFLGDRLVAASANASPAGMADPNNAAQRGNVLREVLRTAAQALPAEAQKLLSASFFERNWNQNINGVTMKLDMSRAAYYRHRAAALQQLANAVTSLIQPALHLELPPIGPRPLVNRVRELSECISALQANESVAILGNSGTGKTTLGAAVVSNLQSTQPVFWFTLRPPFNDHLNTLAFALAHFLFKQGAGLCWQQLVADRGGTPAAQISTLLQHDLGRVRPAPLLCVDEVDVLHHERTEHAQLIQLLESLQSAAPTLWMGQRLVLGAQRIHELGGFDEIEATLLLERAGLTDLNSAALKQLLAATHGNPALLSIFVSVCQLGQRAGEPMATLLRQLAATPGVDWLMSRLWQRLSEAERSVLSAVSVYQQPAPRDVFADDEAVLAGLIARDVLRADNDLAAGGAGSIYALPTVCSFVLASIAPDVKRSLHLQAAQALEARALFTAAAHHYIQAGETEMAVWLWFQQREGEIQSGQAAAACAIFANVDAAQLADDDDRRALALLRAEWAKLIGDSAAGLHDLQHARWPISHAATPYAQRLRGNLHEMRGQLDQALQSFREGLRVFDAEHARESIRLRTALGYVHFRERDMDAANAAALLAHIEALEFRGTMLMHSNALQAAKVLLDEAMQLAENSPRVSKRMVANLHERLGALAWQLGQLDEAIERLSTAAALNTQIGDTARIPYQRMNLAAAHQAKGDFAEALAQAEQGLATAQTLQHAYLVAGLSANAAEACIHLNRLDDAERHAIHSLQQEEEAVQPYALTALGMVQRGRGDGASAAATLREAVAYAQRIRDQFAEASAWRELGVTLNLFANPAEAQSAFEKALALYEHMQLPSEITKTQKLVNGK